MSDPAIVCEIVCEIDTRHATWRLTRWSYDDAPLVAERRPKHRGGGPAYSVEIDASGDLEFDGVDGVDGVIPFVPRDVLCALVDDARARGVPRVRRAGEREASRLRAQSRDFESRLAVSLGKEVLELRAEVDRLRVELALVTVRASAALRGEP